MKIRTKLISLVLGVVVVLAAAAGVYAALLGSATQIERERGYLLALNDAIKNQLIELDKLPYTALKTGGESFAAANKGLDEAFENLGKIKALPRFSKDIRSALEVMNNLRALNNERLAQLNRDLEVLTADAQAIFHFTNSVNFSMFYSSDFMPEKKALAAAALPHLATFMTDHEIMQDSLVSSEEVIARQFSVIDGEISATRARAFTMAAVVILGIMIALALALANGIAGSIIRIERNISMLKEGDLSGRTIVKSRDEIGALAQNLNYFLDGLSSSLYRIKETSKSNIGVKNRLVDAAIEATSSATRIESSTRSIGRRIADFDSRIAESVGSVGRIVGSITDLNAQIEGQSSMVEEATASVTEMLSSLENMSHVTEKDRASTEELVQVSERGRSVFETAFAKIGEIPQNVGTIREMAVVIRNIASRTKILAMNAAIEAAHAGEAGRGFAVVADEIRKLSEASTASSRDISTSIKIIVSKIDEATAANAETSRAFAAIDERIEGVSESMVEMYGSIDEIRIGSKQILQAMVDLQERSVRVKEGSEAMNEGSSGIKRMMGDLSRISTEVAADISEIGMSVSDIGASIRAVAEFADEVSSGSARLDEEVNRFKTTREAPIEPEAAVENFDGRPDIDLAGECLEAG
jgi:methyl-accepting chemotaxis protein